MDTNLQELLNLRFIKYSACEIVKHPHNFVIRNPLNDKYIRLDTSYFKIFDAMNGDFSVGKIINDTFNIHTQPDITTISQFLYLLYHNEMIQAQTHEDDVILLKYFGKTEGGEINKLFMIVTKVLQLRISIKNTDKYIAWIYKNAGKFIFTKISAVISLLITIIGLILSILWIFENQNHIVNSYKYSGFLNYGFPIFICGIFVTTVFHELGHALTCKHFGRKVISMGCKFSSGIPAFYTDTKDSWMLSNKQRVAIDVAGITANLFFGALLSIVAFIASSWEASIACMVIAILNFFISVYNLNPFLKLDGYYILSDLLDKPNLNEEAIVIFFSSKYWKSLLNQKTTYYFKFLFLYGFFTAIHRTVISLIIPSILIIFAYNKLQNANDIYFFMGLLLILILLVTCYSVDKVREIKKHYKCQLTIPEL